MVKPNAAPSSSSAAAAANDNDADQIKEPHEHDVLCGRGGSINSWKGNERFRTLVEKRKRVYLTARFKREKRLIASSIVQEIQSLEPPGRFLSRNTKKGTWFVIDDDKARDKVSQALRENAPSIRAEIETEINEQRAEIQRAQHETHRPPPNAPANPYYPQGWGYFSYYGYAQQSPPHPAGPMPPPPPHYHPGYNHPQWSAPAPGSMPPPPQSHPQQPPPQHPQHPQQHPQHPQPPPQQQPPPPPQAPSPPPSAPVVSQPQPPPPQQPPPQPRAQQQQFDFSFSPKNPPAHAPAHSHSHTHQQQHQQEQERDRDRERERRSHHTPLQHHHHGHQPAPQHSMRQSQRQPQQEHPQQMRRQQQQQQQDDDKSIFDTTAQFMSSVASWTKDAFSIGNGMSVASNREHDHQETASLASKPIKYVHQPEETQSVVSRARSVHFKDERSISGRSLDNRKPGKPPRIMHSSQISYPRRLKRRGSLGASGGPQNGGRPPPSHNNPMAPVSSVNLDGHNDGMISLITTEGMNSIVEEGPLMMEDYDPVMERKDPNEEYKESEPDPLPISRRAKGSGAGAGEDVNNSMLSAVANQIVMGMGSWDAGSIACGPEATSRLNRGGVPKEVNKYSDTMAVEIEGQEVQLVDMMESQMDIGGDNSVLEDRMPPHEKERLQVDWPSRVGSCHSFFNDSLSLAGASFFSTGYNSRGDPVSPASSMDMDVSSGTDPFSCASSVGGASLCRVFDGEGVPAIRDSMPHALPSPNMQNRGLSSVPSWERSLRSKSPASVGSRDRDHDHDEDHGSLMTKSSEKLMGGSIATMGSMEENNDKPGNGMMAWESHKKE